MNDAATISKRSQLTDAPLSAQNYNGIDLLKIICSFFICVIHIKPFFTCATTDPINYYLQQCISRVAVPFYFAATGFLMFRTPDAPEFGSKIRNYVFRILRFFGLWYVLLFWGGKYQLWYLPASAMAVMVLFVFLRLNFKLKTTGILAILLFLFGLLGGCYRFLLKPFPVINSLFDAYISAFQTTRNGIFFGFPFVFLGAAIASRKKEPNVWMAALGLTVSVALMVLEAYFLKRFSEASSLNCFISLVPATCFLLELARSLKLKSSPVYKKLRTVNFLVFCLHLFTARATASTMSWLRNHTGVDLFPFHFLVSAILVFGISILIEHLSHKPRLRWLRWLYS